MNNKIKTISEHTGLAIYGLGLDREKFEKALSRYTTEVVKECAELFVDQRYMILNPNETFANERVRVLKEHDKDTVRKIKEHFGVE